MRRPIPVLMLAIALCVFLPATPAWAVSDDIPGTPLAVGGAASNSVDAAGPSHVYSLDLIAGQEVYVRCDPGNTYTGSGIVHLLVPGATSVAERELYGEISYEVLGGTPNVDKHGGYFYYVPAVTGTYYLWVERTSGIVNYSLSVARTARALSLAVDSDDIPGTAIGPGTVTGVVSTLADPTDVYAVTLTAGKAATIRLEPLTPFDNHFPALARLYLLDSSAVSIDQAAGRIVAGPQNAIAASSASERRTASIQYTPAKSGTYYVWVQVGPFVGPSSEGHYGMNLPYTLVTSGSGEVSGTGGFSDISGSPYQAAILALSGRGIITGFEDGTFRPDAPVTRQQFAKMIVKTLGYPVTGSETSPFADVPSQIGTDPLYPSRYVAVCVQRGITTGKTATRFAPGESITRQQLITMIVRAAALSDPPATYAVSFGVGQFSLQEHFQNARKAVYGGLLGRLQGVGPSYSFGAAATRGECAQLLHNLSDLAPAQ